MGLIDYQTIRCRFEGDICYLQLNRPDADNTINEKLLTEFSDALDVCWENAKIIVVEGLPQVFCFGADFQALIADATGTPERLYDIWQKLATGPFVSIAHVRGKANAGGIGFVAACDLAIADTSAQFSLSELLFGVMPAYVQPFLIRRIGFQKAHALTLMTKPIGVSEACAIGLVDAFSDDSERLLHKHLQRLKLLNKKAVTRYKDYMSSLDDSLASVKPKALAANREVFTDSETIEKIKRYVTSGRFPWED